MILVLAGTAFWAWQLPDIRFDYDIERLFPLRDSSTSFFRAFQARFGNDNDYLLLGIVADEGVFSRPFLRQVDRLAGELDAKGWSTRVLSPTRLRYPQRNPSPVGPRMLSRPYLHVDDPGRYPADSQRLARDPFLGEVFLSASAPALVVQVYHAGESGDTFCADLRTEVETLLQGHAFREVYIAGKCFGQTTIVRTIRRETALFTGLSIGVIVLFLSLTYRSAGGILLPLAVVFVAVVWTAGLMALTGRPFDFISNIIPTMLLVIGISDAVHLITHFQLNRRYGLLPLPAMLKAVREVGWATLLTTATTAVGFLTLTTSSFLPLVELGWYGTAGLFFALMATYAIIPAIVLSRPQLGRQLHRRHLPWEGALNRLFSWIIRHRMLVLGLSVALIALALAGIQRIRLNNYVLEDLRSNHPQRRAFQFFDTHFTGARGFEAVLRMEDTSRQAVFEPATLQAIDRLDRFLQEEYGVGDLLSPARMMRYAHMAYRDGDPAYFTLPQDTQLLQLLTGRVLERQGPLAPEHYLSFPPGWVRLSGKMKDEGSWRIRRKNERLRAFMEEQMENAPFELVLTGTPHLLDLNNSFLARNVLLGLLAAILLVGVLFALLLGSVRLGLLTLLPNLLPLLFIGGIMGFASIDLKISTSVIFVLAFGIAVDDSIHFLARFRREMRRHERAEDALRQTFCSTGKAIAITTLLLLGGFLSLCFSQFLGTFYLGLLLALTLFFALLADLSLLPVLLLLFYGRKNSTGPRSATLQEKG